MKNINIYNIFSDSDCLPEQMLLDYKKNKLGSKEKHMVEKHIANCDFCADALEGLSLISNQNKIKRAIQDIDKEVDKYVYHKKPKTVSFNLSTKLAIAATIAILIGISFLFIYYIKNYNKTIISNNNIAQTNIQEETKISPILLGDSENIKDVLHNDNEYYEPSIKKSNTLREVLNDKTIESPIIVDQSKTLIKDDKKEELETKKIYEDVLLDMPKKEKEFYDSEKMPETKQADIKSVSDVNKLAGGVNLKEDEKNTEVVYIQKENKKKENIFKIEDIAKTKRNENQAPTAPVVQENSIMQEITFNQALEKFNQKDYNAAKQLFEQIIINNSNNIAAIYYKSLSCFYLDDIDNSILGFNKILKNKKNEYYQDAQWYKALALIKKENKKEAKKILIDIIKNKGIYKLEAEQKIKDI